MAAAPDDYRGRRGCQNQKALIQWDFDATPLDTILATLDVMRQMMNGPIIIMGEAFKPKVRRKLFRFHADDCLPRSLNDAELLVPLIRQRLWVYSQLNSEESSNNKPRRPHRDDVTIGNLRLDFDHRCVYVNDQKVILTPKEFKLLKYLYDNRNQVISREQLLNGVWNYDILGTSRMVDIHISHLRDKIEKDPHRPEWIKTARGFGYLFDAAHLDK